MAIPGTPEYHAEFMARKRAAEAANPSQVGPSPKDIGLDVAMPERAGTPVNLTPQTSFDARPQAAEVVVSRAPAPKERPHGSDSGTRIQSGGGKRAAMREAALASMDARGMPRPQTAAHELAASEGVMADMYEQAGLDGLSMQGAKMVSSVANPEYGITKDYVQTSRSVNDRAMAAQQAIDDAEMLRAAKVADFMEEQSTRQAEAITDMRARQHVQEENAIEAQERTKAAYGLVAKTTERLASAPDVDPGRWWASRSNGQKVAATIGMMGRGLGGGNPQDFLMEHIDRDIDAQKASFAQMATAAGAAQSQMGLARGLYADIRAQTQDEREADEIMRIAKLEQAKADFEAIAARTAIPSVMAQQQQHRLQLEQLIADRRLQLGKIAVHNVKRKTVLTPAYRVVKEPDVVDPKTGKVIAKGQLYKVPVGGPADAARAKYLLEQADKNRGASRDVLAKDIEGQANTAGQIEVVRAKAQAEGAAKGINPENRRMIAKETATPNRVRALAGDLVKMIEDRKGDVPGEGWHIPGLGTASHGLTAEARRFAKLRDELAQYDIVDLTGAVSSEQQDKIIQDLTSGSEDEVLRGLRDIQHAMDTYINTIEGADPEAAAAIRQHTRKGLEGWRGGNVAIEDGRSSVVKENP